MINQGKELLTLSPLSPMKPENKGYF
jgi:hypothetical protein